MSGRRARGLTHHATSVTHQCNLGYSGRWLRMTHRVTSMTHHSNAHDSHGYLGDVGALRGHSSKGAVDSPPIVAGVTVVFITRSYVV
jgi:hypothetical protein